MWASRALVAALLLLHVAVSHADREPHPLDDVLVHMVSVNHHEGISMKLNSTVLEKSGQWFEVSWEGVPVPDFGDWIGLYVPAEADFTQTSPAKYQLATRSLSHMKDGSGQLKFFLINYRQDMKFAFMRGGLSNATVAAVSETIRVVNPNEPLQGHLTLTGQPGEMMLHWATRDSSRPTVKWGTESGVYKWTANAESFTYTPEDLCGPPATTIGWVDPGRQHQAVLKKLEPGRRYFYIYGDQEFGFSKEASFRAAPRTSASETVNILAVADMGQAEKDGSFENYEFASLNTTRLMAEVDDTDKYQLLIHNGDISYARGYATQWDNFFHQQGPLISRMPYMVTPGNHERDYPGSGDRYNNNVDSGGECGVAYEKRIRMPLKEVGKQWYSFNFGPIHFLQYSTEDEFMPGSEQYQFIVEDLQRVDRRVTPWVIVGGHRPMYIDSDFEGRVDADIDVSRNLKESFEALFFKYKVDMTWHGHHHSYQRTCPVYRDVCQGYDSKGVAMAPIHLVIGNAGAGLCYNVMPQQPHWIEVLKIWWGYMRLRVNGTHFGCEMVSDYDAGVMDTFTLYKPKDWAEQFHREMEAEEENPGSAWKQTWARMRKSWSGWNLGFKGREPSPHIVAQ